MTPKAWSPLAAVALLALAVGARADGGVPISHEYLAPEPSDALLLGSGAEAWPGDANAIDTASGPVVAPDPVNTPAPTSVYDRDDPAGGDSFVPDRRTERPPIVDYDEPFSPQLTPYKRLHVYDAVREDYSLYVRDPRVVPIVVGGAPSDGDDRFFADLAVQLRADVPIRIPSVGPDARAIRLVTSPAVPVDVVRDGADNWFLRARSNESVRVVLELAAPRDGFAADYPDLPWRALPPVPPPPRALRRSAERVARAVGLTGTMPPRDVVSRMTEYFRSFVPSERPPSTSGDIYVDLALSRKGVCRHRAFAFLVTALYAGIPTRLVHNEAHAWVEVRDDRLWHRIDLGGAASDLQEAARLERPVHRSPPDRFAWPNGRDGGADLGSRSRDRAEQLAASSRAGAAADSEAGATATAGPEVAQAPSESASSGLGSPAADFAGPRLPAMLTLEGIDRDLFRGKPLRVRGRLSSASGPCAQARIDVVVRSAVGAERRVGSLATDERGGYDGTVLLPHDLPLGEQSLFVVTPGSAGCAAARAE